MIIVKDELLFDTNTLVHLDGTEVCQIFSAINNIDSELSLPENFRVSKFVLDPNLRFEFNDGKIILKVYVNKLKEILVPYFNESFSDYIIADNVLYFLSSKANVIKDLLSSLNIYNLQNLSFSNYIKLLGLLKENFITYFDNCYESFRDHFSKRKNKDNLLNAKLYPYQEVGYSWIEFMIKNGCGCLLADEMGLGKTLQIIAVIGSLLKSKPNANILIIAPVSLIENWRREFYKFYPTITTLVHHGSKRTGLYLTLMEYNVVITSYSCIQNDFSMFNMIAWDLVVLDEAQNIKNPYSMRTKFVKQLNKKIGIVVTGTPFENHISDLWSLIDFAIPNYVGKLSDFETIYSDDYSGASMIEEKLTPIMIRRKVAEVADDLPDKVEITQPIIMSEEEAKYYDEGRTEFVKNPLKQLKIEKIQGLRMFCTHPLIYKKNLTYQDPTLLSTKYQRMIEILDEIFAKKEKALIFTSFNGMIDLMLNDLPKRFEAYVNFINGSVQPKDRQKIIDEFEKIDGAAVLLLNPKAAGTGLNITAANHVIHYNLEWNPALQDQASARAYRRGQVKTVFIYKLFYNDTIEEVINDRIERKRSLANTAVVGTDGENYDEEDLLKALNLTPFKE